MYHLRYKTHFDAAHFLRGYEGKCANLHGHRWHVQLELSGLQLNDQGILIDFGDLKRMLAEILPDHCCLNDLESFKTVNPTAENISRHLFKEISKRMGGWTRLDSLELWESEGASAVVYRDDVDRGDFNHE